MYVTWCLIFYVYADICVTFPFCCFVFSTLIPKANSWLQENLDIYLVKCETIEKKVTAVDDVTADNCMFVPKNHAIYVKGLRYSAFCDILISS